jgi:hypothetical protein
LEIIRQSALIFAVSPGLIFKGDEKNWEKLGSWANRDLVPINKKTTATIRFLVFIVIVLRVHFMS